MEKRTTTTQVHGVENTYYICTHRVHKSNYGRFSPGVGLMTVFKITSKHVKKHKELEYYDLGLYGVKISDDREVMVYETKAIAEKALAYFRKTFK